MIQPGVDKSLVAFRSKKHQSPVTDTVQDGVIYGINNLYNDDKDSHG